MKYIFNNKEGFTLVETLIATLIFTLITFSAVNILTSSSNASKRVVSNNELFEGVRTTIDFITAHVARANLIELRTNDAKTLINMNLTYTDYGSSSITTNAIAYSPNLSRVTFGGNEVASYISDIKISVEDGIMNIEVTSSEKLGPNQSETFEPVILSVKIDVRYKDIIVN